MPTHMTFRQTVVTRHQHACDCEDIFRRQLRDLMLSKMFSKIEDRVIMDQELPALLLPKPIVLSTKFKFYP